MDRAKRITVSQLFRSPSAVINLTTRGRRIVYDVHEAHQGGIIDRKRRTDVVVDSWVACQACGGIKADPSTLMSVLAQRTMSVAAGDVKKGPLTIRGQVFDWQNFKEKKPKTLLYRVPCTVQAALQQRHPWSCP